VGELPAPPGRVGRAGSLPGWGRAAPGAGPRRGLRPRRPPAVGRARRPGGAAGGGPSARRGV